MTSLLLLLFLPLLAEAAAIAATKAEVRAYFVAQLICTVACWRAAQDWPLDSNHYRAIYVTATLPVILTSFWIVWKRGVRWAFLVAAAFALFPAIVLMSRFQGSKGPDFWIVASEGCLLAFLAAALGPRAVASRERHVLVALCLIWAFLAVYDFHFLLNRHIAVFEVVAPAWVVEAGCLWVALHPIS